MNYLSSLFTCVWLAISFSARAQSQTQRLIPFQGRLTDRSGKAFPDGVRVVQFQVYSDAAGAQAAWAGEVHRVTVNNGLVNVVLGTKNPLPRDRANQPDKSFFDQPLYLQITPDANDDNQITEIDPPLLPRQALVPVIFAQDADSARKLQGYDWSVLFGTNSPALGKIAGSRILDGTVTASQIAPGTITGDRIAQGSILGMNLADGSVLPVKLAPRVVGVSEAFAGSITTAGISAVPGLSVTIPTTGRPVFVGLQGAPGQNSDMKSAANEARIHFLRDGRKLSAQVLSYVGYSPSSSFWFIDSNAPVSPRTTYSLSVENNGTSVGLSAIQLVAYEL